MVITKWLIIILIDLSLRIKRFTINARIHYVLILATQLLLPDLSIVRQKDVATKCILPIVVILKQWRIPMLTKRDGNIVEPVMPGDTEKPEPVSAFSKRNPNLQLSWDASSLKAYQFCPRYYELTNIEGWRGNSVDLEFGGLIASGFERFKKARLNGKSIDDALLETVRWALEETYNQDDGTQWGGRYETMWKCTGEKPYKNSKGNRAKCPFAHEKAWFPDEAPDVCGECGSPIRTERRYIPGSNQKNRYTLVRTLIWYASSQPEDLHDGFYPYVFPDGTPAVELSDRMPLPFKSLHGEQYILSWNFDYIGNYGSEQFIVDNKTTAKTLDQKYFNSFSPDTQFDTYAMVGAIAYPDLNIKGVMVEGVQIAVGFSEFGLHPYYKRPEQNEEHLNDMEWWIRQAEHNAESGYWPMNKRNCWLCPLKAVCSQPKSQRDGYLASNFTKQPRWNPLKER